MPVSIAFRLILILFFAIFVVYGLRITWRNMVASRKNVQIKDDSRAQLARIKKMLPLGLLATLAIVALNVMPVLFRHTDFGVPGFLLFFAAVAALTYRLLPPILRRMNAVAMEDIAQKVMTAPEILTSGARPVLYLRPFSIDGSTSSEWSLAQKFGLAVPTTEAEMVSVLREHGPVVAIGLPGEPIVQDIGAARIQCTDEEWQGQILEWMSRATLIVMTIGVSEGVLWELASLEKHRYIEKCIFIIDAQTAPPEHLLGILREFLNRNHISLEGECANRCIAFSTSPTTFTLIPEPMDWLQSGRNRALQQALEQKRKIDGIPTSIPTA